MEVVVRLDEGLGVDDLLDSPPGDLRIVVLSDEDTPVRRPSAGVLYCRRLGALGTPVAVGRVTVDQLESLAESRAVQRIEEPAEFAANR